jgi:centrin-3
MLIIVIILVTVTEKILARDPMEEIRRAFQLFDDDNTGKISIRNLRRVAKEIGDRLEDDELCVYLSIFTPLVRAD